MIIDKQIELLLNKTKEEKMISDSAKIPYTLNYDISPILASKFNPFNEQTILHNQFCNFSPEKMKCTPEFKTAESSNCPFSFGKQFPYDMSAFENKVSIQPSNQGKSLVFSSQIFNSIKSVPVTIIQKKSPIKKISHRSKIEPSISVIINEVIINGAQLRNYPFIPIEEKWTEVILCRNLIEKKKYFVVNQSSTSLTCSYSQRYYCFPIDRLEKIELTQSQLILNNITNYMPNETSSIKIIKKYYEDIRNLLLLLNKYYLSRKPRIYSEKAVLEIEKLIYQCNLFTDYLRKVYIVLSQNFVVSKAIGHNQYSNNLSQVKKQTNPIMFKCSYCRKKFSNGQSLGGHISQSHPRQSTKYKKKIEIRNNRVNQRMIIVQSRIALFTKYGLDYETLKMGKDNKEVIRQLIVKHKNEYKKIILSKKKELLNSDNY